MTRKPGSGRAVILPNNILILTPMSMEIQSLLSQILITGLCNLADSTVYEVTEARLISKESDANCK
jgi:hypothetical protein